MRVQAPESGSSHQATNLASGDAPRAIEWPNPRTGGQQFSEPEGIPWPRYLDAIKRHILLIIALTAVGSAIGFFLTTRMSPLYDVQATVWINTERPGNTVTGPIRVQRHIPSSSWVELLRSYAVVDPVVKRLRLNVSYREPGDSVLFRSFESLSQLRPGSYTLKLDGAGRGYTLMDARDSVLEQGVIGDTIGRAAGFAWAPEKEFLSKGRSVAFSLETPRSTSEKLIGAMRPHLAEEGQFLRIVLSGDDPHRIAATVNAWAEQLVRSSADLKKRHLFEFEKVLGEQLAVAAGQLRSAEVQLERFREQTITLPLGGSPVAGGQGADPLVSNYFQQKITLDEMRSDRVALERLINDAGTGALNTQGFLQLPAILNNAPQLRAAIEELSSRQAALRTEQQYLTDANPRIKQLAEAVRVLERETIPRIANSVLASMRAREPELSQRIAAQSSELRAIPSRATEQLRLVRQVVANEHLYNILKARHEEITMAEAQVSPDVSLLDTAVPPTWPSSNEAPRMLLLAVLASVGLALAIALGHDRLDRRFRYPEQATRELGLTIAGTVPRLKPN